MKLGILLPVKDSADTIDKCLYSIQNQTSFLNNNFDYEIVLIDNNSKDNLKEKIQKYKNIKYLSCGIDGIVPTLNTGLFNILNNSNIKYIARIDADDEWLPNKIEKQMTFLLDNKHIHICGTQMYFIKANEDVDLPFEITPYPIDDTSIKTSLINGMNPIGHPSVIYSKEIFLKFGGYDETYKHAEDLDLWLKCLKFFNFANINEPLVNYKFSKKWYNEIQSKNCNLLNKRTGDLYFTI
jgi:glycosyltransferase involved in cell wall biosynthesis